MHTAATDQWTPTTALAGCHQSRLRRFWASHGLSVQSYLGGVTTTMEYAGGPPPRLRPDRLRIQLTASLPSQRQHQSDDFGWECWYATILGGWDSYDDPERGADVAAKLDTIFPGSGLQADPDELEVEIGGCELMLLRFDVPHPVFGEDVAVASFGESIYEAADALSQDLVDLLGPMVDLESQDPFVEQVMNASEHGWYDELLIVRSAGINEHFRGMGIGGWAVARAIGHLASEGTTLVALKAAPLNRSDFLRDVGADPDSRDDLTAEQAMAWDAACARIAANWIHHLGVHELDRHPGILFGPGGPNDALAATLVAWREGLLHDQVTR